MSERASKNSVVTSPDGATPDEHPALRTLRLALAEIDAPVDLTNPMPLEDRICLLADIADEALLAVPAFFGIALCAIAARAPRTGFDRAQRAWLASQECYRLRNFFKRAGERD